MTEYTLEQMKEHRRLWVEALRSGKYKQGAGCLRSEDNHFCCLGVLCDIAGVEWSDQAGTFGFVADGETAVHAPPAAEEFVGLHSSYGFYERGRGIERSLMTDNDDGSSFAEIADLIESNPPGLFIDRVEEPQ